MPTQSEDVKQTVEVDVGNMEAELMRWSAKLEELRAKTPAAGSEAKFDYRKRVDDMREKYEAAEQKLRELKTAGSAEWDTFRGGVESAWSELADAYRKLAN
jgi:uncharacterized membrane protein